MAGKKSGGANTIPSESKKRSPPDAVACCLVDHANARTLTAIFEKVCANKDDAMVEKVSARERGVGEGAKGRNGWSGLGLRVGWPGRGGGGRWSLWPCSAAWRLLDVGVWPIYWVAAGLH